MNEQFTFVCGLCQQRFDRPEHLDAHMAASHAERHIEIPEEEGNVSCILTWSSGLTTHLFIGEVDGEVWTMDRYIVDIEEFISSDRSINALQLIGFPNANRPEWKIWFGRENLLKNLQHIHQSITMSPQAVRKMAGQQLAVAREVPPGIPVHGPGKRGRN